MKSMAHGYNQDNIQDMNRTLLLHLLRKEGICSRAHLARISQLKQATVTNIVNDFIQWGLVKEVGFLLGEKGRRSIGISINRDGFGILTIRLARKNYTVAICDLSGHMIDTIRRELSLSQLPEETFQRIVEDLNSLRTKYAARRILAIGMALPGPYSERRGRIELMTGVSGWNKIPLREKLQELFHLPVFIEQDANAGALAQNWYNSDYSEENSLLVYIAVGQGVGAGIIDHGELLKGAVGVAGEIGHMSICYNGPKCACGNYGCLENYCSSISFVEQVNRQLGTEYQLQQVAELLRQGNETVTEVFFEVCDKLSVGIINLINCFNPNIIVIGDEMSHIAPDLMLKRVQAYVKERVLPEIYSHTMLTMSMVAADSISHGAAIAAINDIFRFPLNYF